MAESDISDKLEGDIPQINGDVPLSENEALSIEASLEKMESDETPKVSSPANVETPVVSMDTDKNDEIDSKQGVKRSAPEDSDNEMELQPCISLQSDNEDGEDLKGFEASVLDDYKTVLDKIQAVIKRNEESLKPARPIRRGRQWSAKRIRTETPTSRPSSGLSHKSDGEQLSSTDVGSSAASSPASFRGKRPEITAKQYRIPIELGWKRELVFRAAVDTSTKRNADVYYYAPDGKKLRSTREVADYIHGSKQLTLDNFTFFKEPLGLDDPEKEIIRDAKVMRKEQVTPVRAPVAVEGKRTPKPKVKPAEEVTPAKIKVKSLGSRLSGSSGSAPSTPTVASKTKKPATPTNNNTNWKKPSAADSPSVRARNAALTAKNATPASPALTPKKRGRRAKISTESAESSPAADVDYFAELYSKCEKKKYNVAVQIFQYLQMRELAAAARVCRLWRKLADHKELWRHVRMKNSQVSDWKGLCAALKKHETKRLDLRKMLLPQNDVDFWEQFTKHIPSVTSLQHLELCRCPARVVESVCNSMPGLRVLGALAVRDTQLDPTNFANMTKLNELRIKSMAGFTLTRDLKPLAKLHNLTHLSLTSIKDLGKASCAIIGDLKSLEVLELGECSFGSELSGVVTSLERLTRLRLERGAAECGSAAANLIRGLARLPALTHLELVNFDVKVGFDEALATCTNIRRLLIIPTYVSQSATTNKQVLSGVLRLKDTLTHLMWGVTIELLRVTELFIDQCDQAGEKKKPNIGECIPVLKPVPGLATLPQAQHNHPSPPQVEILPLPSLQKLLSSSLPHTKLKLLRIPFHATWRQTLADFQ